MQISVENPQEHVDVRDLLSAHLEEMHSISPPESVHALNADALGGSDIVFFCAREAGELLGCGALKLHNGTLGEVKSMRTASSSRGQGVARSVLEQIMATARERGLTRLSLETGAEAHFRPAVRLYERHGFVPCGPFADYVADPNSLFFTVEL